MAEAAAQVPGTLSVSSASELRQTLSVCAAFVRNAFLNMLAYRLRYFTGIITYLLFVSVHYFIWQAVFAGNPPGTLINGFSLDEMVSYVAIGWIARSLYFSNVDHEINEHVRTGQISVFLLRPISFHLMQVAQAAGETLFRFLFFTIPIGIVILLVFPVSPPASVAHFFLFLLGTMLSFLVLAEINFIVGLCAFWFKSIDGLMRAKYFLVQLLSGLLLPLTFFPAWLQTITDYLPFKAIAYIPLQFYLGKVHLAEASWLLAQQAFWVMALFLFSRFVWRRAMGVLTLQGG